MLNKDAFIAFVIFKERGMSIKKSRLARHTRYAKLENNNEKEDGQGLEDKVHLFYIRSVRHIFFKVRISVIRFTSLVEGNR